MIERYFVKANMYGNTYQLVVDYKNKTFTTGYFLFNPVFNECKKVSKSYINGIVDILIRMGFKRIYG